MSRPHFSLFRALFHVVLLGPLLGLAEPKAQIEGYFAPAQAQFDKEHFAAIASETPLWES